MININNQEEGKSGKKPKKRLLTARLELNHPLAKRVGPTTGNHDLGATQPKVLPPLLLIKVKQEFLKIIKA